MITAILKGGLGNQLFILAAVEYYSKRCNKNYYRDTPTNPSPHTDIDYFDTIFKNWNTTEYIQDSIVLHEPIHEEHMNYHKNIVIDGYFQDYRFISDKFIQKLCFPTLNEDYSDGVFLHIRGGDYKNNWLHDVQLDTYYQRAIDMFPKDTKFYIFTNDIHYAVKKEFLNTIHHEFIIGDEIHSLYAMSQCKGAICANSTLSWWGAFLNKNRQIIMPSKWFNDGRDSTRYFFEEVTVVDTSLWDFIDKVVYINLKERVDRNERMKNVTNTFGDKVIRYDAIRYEKGYIGCSMSHLEVLTMAKKNNWKNVLILEDDIEWNNFDEGYAKLKKLIKTNYDVIMLGGTSIQTDGSKLVSAQCTSSYLVNNHYYDTLLDNFNEGLFCLLHDDYPDTYAIDQHWKHLQRKDTWFIIEPCLLYQIFDYSDIQKRNVDYRDAFKLQH